MSPHSLFEDRAEAGRRLAARLTSYRDASPIVLGLPRGGVPVAYEIARALGAPLDVCVVRKIGAPLRPELAIGAVAEAGALCLDRGLIQRMNVEDDELAGLIAARRAEIVERVERFRRGGPPLDVRGKTVLVVDDGIATGSTARAALQTLRARGAARLVLAVPVGASDSLERLAADADEIVCLHAEAPLHAVGLWYDDFSATTDDEVVELLDVARSEQERSERQQLTSERVRVRVDRDVRIPLANGVLEGRLTIPSGSRGLVIFAHGSGSSRRSPDDQRVARSLQGEGLATLLFDLLTDEEERIDEGTGHLRFDIELLASRLVTATDWALAEPQTRALDIGYFGASTGAAAALVAAAERPRAVRAVVCRGARPDLAETSLGLVAAPTLLIVGGADPEVLQINRESLYFLWCDKRLDVISGATHSFEEPGALEAVAHSAALWFCGHLGEQALASIA